MKWHHGHNKAIVNGVPRIGYMKGGEKAKWSDIDMADEFINKAKEYLDTVKDKPFSILLTSTTTCSKNTSPKICWNFRNGT